MRRFKFGGGLGYNYDAPGVTRAVETLLGAPVTGKQHIMLNEKSIISLKKGTFRVSVNTLGQRFYLYLTTTDTGKRHCIFINRKTGQLVLCQQRFSTDLFEGTLFEGELVRCAGTAGAAVAYTFLLGDVLYMRGVQVTLALPERLVLMKQTFTDLYEHEPTNLVCKYEVKRYVDYCHIVSFINDYIPRLPYHETVTGLYFKYTKEPVSVGPFKDIMYVFQNHRPMPVAVATVADEAADKIEAAPPPKAKPKAASPKQPPAGKREAPYKPYDGEEQVFDIRSTDKPDVYNLYVNGVHEGIAAIPGLSTSEMLENVFIEYDSHAFNCRYADKFKKWVPISPVAATGVTA